MMSPLNDSDSSPAFAPGFFHEHSQEAVAFLRDLLARLNEHSETKVVDWRSPKESLSDWPADFTANPSATLRGFLEAAAARSMQLHHPRYLGHQVAAPLPLAAVLEFAAALLNNGMAVYEMGPAATAIEINLVKWLGRRLGFGDSCGGVFTSGGSAGNLTALLAARRKHAGFDAWSRGLAGSKPLAILASSECHYSVARAAAIMGLGTEGVVKVPVDGDFRLIPRALPEAFEEAKRRGRAPIAVAASACSTATGAFDPLREIGAFCRERDLWFHVDGAHGASAALSSRYRHLLDGVEFADSVVWDAHKMALMPALVTAVIFREDGDSWRAFAQQAPYLLDDAGETAGFDQAGRTIECTKRMMAFEWYGCLKILGTKVFSDFVERQFDLARAFADKIRSLKDFELACAPQANIVCFRFVPKDFSGDLDALQIRIRDKLLKEGRFYIVRTTLPRGVFLRVSLMNPKTTLGDLEALPDAIREAAKV